MALSASSRKRRKRQLKREANNSSTNATAAKAMSVTAVNCWNARLPSDTMASVVSSTTTTPTTLSPTQMGCAAESMAVRRCALERRRRLGVPSSARSSSLPPKMTSLGMNSSSGATGGGNMRVNKGVSAAFTAFSSGPKLAASFAALGLVSRLPAAATSCSLGSITQMRRPARAKPETMVRTSSEADVLSDSSVGVGGGIGLGGSCFSGAG